MNRDHIFVAAVIILITFVSNSWSMPISSSDLWDISNGTTVTANSPLHSASYSKASNMFGDFTATNNYNEGENTLFSDRQVDDFIHYVEWETANPVTVNSFNLVASHAPEPQYSRNDRGFKNFSLYYSTDDSSEWIMLYSYDTLSPYGGGENYPESNYLELYDTFSIVTAQQFRAEFVQAGRRDVNTYSAGPRIFELDGYYTVPEPASLLLTTLGIMGLSGFRKTNSRK